MIKKPAFPFLMILFLAGVCVTAPAWAFQSVVKPSNTSQITYYRTKITSLQTQIERTQVAQENAQKRLVEVRARRDSILEQQLAAGVSNESYAEIMRSLQLQRVELSIDLAGLDARSNALAEMSQTGRVNQIEQEIIMKLKEQVDLMRDSVELAKQQVIEGMVSPNELRQAEQKLLIAEVKLLEFQHSSTSGTNQPVELRDVSLDRAEKSARLVKVEELLLKISAARKQIEEAAMLDRAGDQWRKKLQTAEEDLHTFQEGMLAAERELESYLSESEDH